MAGQIYTALDVNREPSWAEPAAPFVAIIESRSTEISRLRTYLASERLGSGGRRRVELYLQFWEELLPEAVTSSYGHIGSAGQSLVFDRLQDLYEGYTQNDISKVWTTQ